MKVWRTAVKDWDCILIHSGVRHLFQGLGALILGIMIAIPLLVWRLSVGPLQLDFLTPYIQASAQAKDGSWRTELDGTQLALGEGRHMVEFQILGVRFYQASDHPLLTIPRLSVSFNVQSLLGGMLAPSSLRLKDAKIHLERDAQGHVNWGIGEPSAQTVQPEAGPSTGALLLDSLIGEYDPYKPGRQLRELVVSHAQVILDDQANGVVWSLPDTSFTVHRTLNGATLNGSLDIDDPDHGLAHIAVTAAYQHPRPGEPTPQGLGGRWLAQTDFTNFRLAPLNRIGPDFAGLSMFDFPLAGRIGASGDLSGEDLKIDFDLAGGSGRLRMMDPDATQYDMAGLSLRGGYDLGQHRLTFEQVKAVVADGPVLGIKGQIDGVGAEGQGMTWAFDGTYDRLAFDDLSKLWPRQLAPDPREWIVENLSKGMAHDGVITLRATSKPGQPGDIDVQKVEGRFKADNVTVRYLAPMPPIQGVGGDVSFDDKSFTINISSGQVWGVKLKTAKVVLGDLDKPVPKAEIVGDASSTLSDTLRLIDQKPLEYAQAMHIDPSQLGGTAETRLQLRFPLLKDVRLSDLVVQVHSAMTEVKMPKVLMDQDLAHGKLMLDLDGKGMDVTGPVELAGIPAKLAWRENFTSKAPFRSRYEITAEDVASSSLGVFGLDTVPFTPPWMDGLLSAKVVAVANGQGRTDVAIDADLTDARMTLPGMGWRKEDRTTGGAKAQLVVKGGKLAEIPHFEVVAGDLQADGGLDLVDGHVRRITFNRFNYGRTAMGGTIEMKAGGGMAMTFKGSAFDAEPLVSTSDDTADKPQDPNAPLMTIDAQFKHVWLSKTGGVDNTKAQLHTDLGDWRAIAVKGQVGTDHKPFSFVVSPLSATRRDLKIQSDDAGAMLRAFDVYDDMMGGTMTIDGAFSDDKPHKPLDGTIRIEQFNVVNTPALARLLTVASLTGVVDVLKGEGVSFSNLEAPFQLADGRLRIHDGRAAGSALGLTANGDIDMKLNRLALEGTLVPFYSLNSALADIPGLNWLTSGGEKGGGLVAFNFSMKGSPDDPDVTINPLSALTPGFLRRFFDLFGSEGDTNTRK